MASNPEHTGDRQQDAQDLDINSPFRVAEFTALRQEIIKHVDLHYQLQSLTVLVAGALITIGVQGNAGVGAAVLLMYPVIAAFLAAAFGAHEQTIALIAYYIRTRFEQDAKGRGWETFLHEEIRHPKEQGRLRETAGIHPNDQTGRKRGFVTANSGLFLITELGTVALGVSRLAGVLVFTTSTSPSLQLDVQAVHSLMYPLAILLALDVAAGIQTVRALHPPVLMPRTLMPRTEHNQQAQIPGVMGSPRRI